MSSREAYTAGIDLGGTQVKMVAMGLDGRLFERFVTDTDESTGAWLGNIREVLNRLEREFGEPKAIGLAAPGLAARDERSIAWMQGRMSAIQGFDWTEALGSTEPIPVLNDAHAALLGEVWIGAAAGSRNVAMLTLGTGVGGAAMVDGHLLRGHIGRAGHLGHMSLNPAGTPDIVGTPGSLEDAVGECGLPARTGQCFTTTVALLAAAANGDAEAQAYWQDSVRALAAGIVSVVNVLDPEILIVGGGVAAAGDRLFKPLQEHLNTMEWRPLGTGVKIAGAALGPWAGAVGAARYAATGLRKESK